MLLLKIQIYNEDIDASLGAWQAHDTSVRLIFPALVLNMKHLKVQKTAVVKFQKSCERSKKCGCESSK